jgi:cysteine-rich repeat protein
MHEAGSLLAEVGNMSNPRGHSFELGRLNALHLCCIALFGCTDIESLKGQLSGHDAGAITDGNMPTGGGGGAAGESQAGIGGGGGSVSPSTGGMGGAMAAGQGGTGAAGMAGIGSTSGNADTADMEPSCGDGTPDADEECDDGNDVETDACTSECVNARCGDGLLRADTEQCDDANDVDDDNCSNACEKHYNIAFVTSTTYNVLSLGGLAGGDAACAARATAAGLPGTFVAWMSTSETSIASRLTGARGWVRPDGKPFLDEVEGQATFYPPSLNEHGALVTEDWPPALGGYTYGASDNECDDWTTESRDVYFLLGDPTAGTGAWNGGWSGTGCSSPFRLYCLQRDYSNVLTFEPTEGRLAFVSNMPWFPTGGLAAADARCNQDALDAGLSGTFKALLSTSTASAASRFSPAGATWVRRDGIPIVAQAADLFDADGLLLAPLQITAYGSYLGNYGGWSGGADPNQAGSSTCSNWTSALPGALGTSGRVFLGKVTGMLGHDVDLPCNSMYNHLYCLEE